MAKKGKRKDESKKKEEISPIIADHKLQKTVLHYMPRRTSIHKMNDGRKGRPRR
jgi:hypothetical protein